MHNYKELIAWKKARALTKDIYFLSGVFPKSESFGLTQQIRRALISIPSNIAEGAGRTTNTDFCRFLDIANGSAFEVETQAYLAFDLGLISDTNLLEVLPKIQDVQRLIFAFKKSLNAQS